MKVKRLILALLLAVAIVAAIVLVRAFAVSSMQLQVAPAPELALDRDAALARFSRALQFRTISWQEPGPPVEHEEFVAWLASAYPRVHGSMEREIAGGQSLLYTWRGSDAGRAPLLLMGHYDVVPVEPGTEGRWTHPPFSGAIDGGYVWGRGALDDKTTVAGLLEAAEQLLGEGFRPQRTILLSFGHDEEVGGSAGAAVIAGLLESRGVRLEAVLDEGGLVSEGMAPGTTRPVALVGIAEKGSVSVELRATTAGGHSSMPEGRTAVGLVAAAVDRVQRQPFPAQVRGATAEMFRWLAPELRFDRRMAMANLWLFEPLLRAQAQRTPSLNAMLRTTTAPTIIEGGVKENVIPSEARAVINFRLLPGESIDRVLAHVRRAVGDPQVQVERTGSVAMEPSGVSDPTATPFRTLQRTIHQIFPEAVVAPYLVVGGTDSRHFRRLTPNIYRFAPFRLTAEDLSRFHGTNERIAVDDYLNAIRFYRQLMINVQ